MSGPAIRVARVLARRAAQPGQRPPLAPLCAGGDAMTVAQFLRCERWEALDAWADVQEAWEGGWTAGGGADAALAHQVPDDATHWLGPAPVHGTPPTFMIIKAGDDTGLGAFIKHEGARPVWGIWVCDNLYLPTGQIVHPDGGCW